MKNSYKFQYEFSKNGFRIFSQPDTIKRNSGTIYEIDGIRLASVAIPEIRRSCVYLRGDDKSADDILTDGAYISSLPKERYTELANALRKFQKYVELHY